MILTSVKWKNNTVTDIIFGDTEFQLVSERKFFIKYDNALRVAVVTMTIHARYLMQG